GARISPRRRCLSSQHFSAPDLSRAVDDPPQCFFQATRTDDTLDQATCTHGSNPARLMTWVVATAVRAEIFALPHISKLPGPATPWTRQPARMAQTRRVYYMRG